MSVHFDGPSISFSIYIFYFGCSFKSGKVNGFMVSTFETIFMGLVFNLRTEEKLTSFCECRVCSLLNTGE